MKITDKKELVKIISFLVMGDGSVHSNGGTKNCVFSMSMVEKHLDFITYVKDVIDNVTSSRIMFSEREAPRQNMYKVQSLSHPFFNDIRERIYVDSYKSIDPHALKLMDWQCLAILYMCDGCLGKNGGKESFTTTLNLCRLSYGDLLLLKKTIKDKFDLEWNVVKTNRKYYTLRLRMKDFDKFMKGIAPYMFESFNYKLYFRTTGPSQEGGDIVCTPQQCGEDGQK